jgi:hypothetical protein
VLARTIPPAIWTMLIEMPKNARISVPRSKEEARRRKP